MNSPSFIECGTTTTLIVPSLSSAMRIDLFITQQFSHYSRSFFQRLIDQGCVTHNNALVVKQSTLVSPTDKIVLYFPPARATQTEKLSSLAMGVSIIHKHDHFMIIYKPPHLLVHSPSTTSSAITLVDWITHNHAQLKHIGIVDRPGIIHRLDKETSGLLIIARTDHAHQAFGDLFKKREINKTYLAVVEGHPDKEGFVDFAIARDPHNRIKMKAFFSQVYSKKVGSIRSSQTYYKVLEYYANDMNNMKAALVELKPVTGRTHQIRVHMTALGHPLIGDQLYGKKSVLIDRQALHAYSLSFVFDGNSYSFTHEVPEDFQKLISYLRSYQISF